MPGQNFQDEERQARHRALSYGMQPFSRVTEQDLASYEYSRGTIVTRCFPKTRMRNPCSWKQAAKRICIYFADSAVISEQTLLHRGVTERKLRHIWAELFEEYSISSDMKEISGQDSGKGEGPCWQLLDDQTTSLVHAHQHCRCLMVSLQAWQGLPCCSLWELCGSLSLSRCLDHGLL